MPTYLQPASQFTPLHPNQSSGNQLWHNAGAQGTAKPSRTHSEPSTYAPAAEDRLSISPSKTQKFAKSFERSRLAHKPSIVGLDHIDGIIFKTPFTTATGQDHIESGLQQSTSTEGHPHQYPHLPPLGETPENLTRDAGHTPLAPVGSVQDVANSPIGSSAASSSQADNGTPPLEPRTAMVRKPLERSDSYFPHLEESDDDPELRQPLSLQHSLFDDNHFLKQVDNKLLQAKQSATLPAATFPNETPSSLHSNGDDKEPPEPDLPFVFKKSLNFGSQLGNFGSGQGYTMVE
ncbi:MAG: hypothetical protein LQ352_005368 [Teloschistes flavicans]|nr:MAG: hypothetical protein LQ352_005368 [Teloschistes flavicans]